MRSDILSYCGAIAANPDPNDPEIIQKEVERQKAVENQVDVRLDPYTGQVHHREGRIDQLASFIRQETQVERIIRQRTWAVVRDRCGMQQGCEDALREWKEYSSIS